MAHIISTHTVWAIISGMAQPGCKGWWGWEMWAWAGWASSAWALLSGERFCHLCPSKVQGKIGDLNSTPQGEPVYLAVLGIEVSRQMRLVRQLQLEIIILSEVSQKETNAIWCHFCMESKMWHQWTYLWNRITHLENRLLAVKGKGTGERTE